MKIKTKLNISNEILTHVNDTNLTRDSDTSLIGGTHIVPCHNYGSSYGQHFLKFKKQL